MRTARRTLLAAIVLGTGAVALTGCILPPPIPSAAPAQPPVVEESAVAEPRTPETEGASDPAAPVGDLPFTVDDGYGDVWSFDVVEVVADPPLESGVPAPGTHVVGVVIDARHDEGGVSFDGCFEILVEGTDGQTYAYADTIGPLTPENDIFFASTDAFTGAVAAVQLPEGVDPARVILRSAYGHPEVADTVIDIQ